MSGDLYDSDIREPLFSFLEDRFGTVRFLEEKNIGRSRADIVMVTVDSLVGIEIKSDRDSYARLTRQVRDYDRFCDMNIAVVGVRHTDGIWDHIPEWWGIITAEYTDDTVDLYMDRRPRPNPVSAMKEKLGILWRSELEHILLENGFRAYTSKNKRFIADKLMMSVDEALLSRQISHELFERDYNEAEKQASRRRIVKKLKKRKVSGGMR